MRHTPSSAVFESGPLPPPPGSGPFLSKAALLNSLKSMILRRWHISSVRSDDKIDLAFWVDEFEVVCRLIICLMIPDAFATQSGERIDKYWGSSMKASMCSGDDQCGPSERYRPRAPNRGRVALSRGVDRALLLLYRGEGASETSSLSKSGLYSPVAAFVAM